MISKGLADWGECYGRQGFDKNLTPQTGCGFRAFGNSFVAYMVL